jgi:uncharacterized membrane protein
MTKITNEVLLFAIIILLIFIIVAFAYLYFDRPFPTLEHLPLPAHFWKIEYAILFTIH